MTVKKCAQYGEVEEKENFRFRITCSKFEKFEAGAQVYIQYGKSSNWQLLTNYGFTIKNNPFDYARLKINLEEFLSFSHINKIPNGYDPNNEAVFKLKFQEFPLKLLSAYRAFLWNIDQHPASAFYNPVDLHLELACIQKITQKLISFYESFATTIEEDQILLKTASIRLYFAVILR